MAIKQRSQVSSQSENTQKETEKGRTLLTQQHTHAHTCAHRVTPVCSLLLSLMFIYKHVYIDPLTLETQVNSHMHTYTHKHTHTHTRERVCICGNFSTGTRLVPAWDRGSETPRARGPGKEGEREMEKERERREIKTSQRAGARLRAGKGVRARAA